MKRRWQQIAERIDNASLRERGLIFLTLAVVLLVLLDAVLLAPESARERRLRQEIQQHQSDAAKVGEQLQKLAMARSSDPDSDARARLEVLKSEVSAVEAVIAEEQRKFTDPAQMRTVLEGLVDRSKGVRVVEFRTLAPVPISETRPGEKPAAEKPAAVKPAPGAERFVYRHGFEITVTGAYADLHRYLTTLERLPTRLHWGVAELGAASHPQLTLKLTVHTLSLDKSWMSA